MACACMFVGVYIRIVFCVVIFVAIIIRTGIKKMLKLKPNILISTYTLTLSAFDMNLPNALHKCARQTELPWAKKVNFND